MTDDIKTRKQMLREEAVRTRGLLSLSREDLDHFSALFFEHIPLPAGSIVAGYWPKDREFDVRPLLEELVHKGVTVCLPVDEKGHKVLRFARWQEGIEMVQGAFGVYHPVTSQFLEPDVFLVPMLAFDTQGRRLGYGGGYYDATLSAARTHKKIVAVGVAYARQACLFSLPSEDHDIKMDWILTEQAAHRF